MADNTLPKALLTYRTIEGLKSEPTAYRVPDARCPGLAVRVAPSGLKSWEVAVRIRGTKIVRRKALGAFPAVSLDTARQRAAEIARWAQTGRDLIAEEKAERERADAELTVGALISEYIRRRAKQLRTRHEIELRLRRALAPLVDNAAGKIRKRDIGALLNATVDRGAPREAEKQRQSICAMFSWALAQDLVEHNPSTGLQALSTGSRRDRVLSPEEIKLFWDWVTNGDLAPDMQDALKLQLCLGCRIGEASGMRAEEIDERSWLWTLPAARSKNKQPRVTPLIGIARDIVVERLHRTTRGPFFVNETGKALASNDIGSAIVTRRNRIPIDHFVSHDLRRTVATQLVELGISLDLTAAILGHAAGDRNVRVLIRHYVRTDQIEMKRSALAAWDRRLKTMIADQPHSNVIELQTQLR